MEPKAMMPETAAGDSEHFHFAGALLDSMARGVIVVSSSRQVLAFSEAAGQLTGLRAPDVLGRPASVLPPALLTVIDETLTKGKPISRRNVHLSHVQKESALLQVSTQVARQQDDSVLSVFVELQNGAQAHAIGVNLEHLDRLANLGVLGAGIAHEIRNALVAVRTFVDLLVERSKDDELAQLVSEEIARIDAIVQQVLRDAVREEFNMAPLNTHALVKDALKLLRNELQARSIRPTLKLNASSDQIRGDERQLRHALLNLLINAIEAMNDGGQLHVSTELSTISGRQYLSLTVSDSGSGVRPEHLPRLFSPFFTTKKEGTGLGLAITRRIIQQHDGTITVESKVNEGTTFRVFLPLLGLRTSEP
jgi:signal transduction histidine kinase